MNVQNEKNNLARSLLKRARSCFSKPRRRASLVALLALCLLLPLWGWVRTTYQKQAAILNSAGTVPISAPRGFQYIGLVMIGAIVALLYIAVNRQARLEGRIAQRVAELQRELAARQRAEEALNHERTLLRTLVDLLPDSIYAKDVESRKTLANPVDLLYMGAGVEEEAIGKSDFEVYPEEMAIKFYIDDQSVIQTGKPLFNREERIIHPDGTLHWLLTSKVPIRDHASGEVIGLIGVGRDITDRKQVEEALAVERESLRKSENRYRRLFEDAPISLWEEDFSYVKAYLDTLREAGITDFDTYFALNPEVIYHCLSLVKIVDVNQVTLDMYGAKNKEDFFTRLHQHGREELFDVFKQELLVLVEGYTTYQGEAVAYISDHEEKRIIMKLFLSPGYEYTWAKVLVGILDITERKRMEEALRQARDELEQRVRERTAELQAQYLRLDAILRSTTDGIIVTDAEGAILQTNPVARTWLTQTLPPTDVTALREVIFQVATRSQDPSSTLLELTGLDLELSGAPLTESLAENSPSLPTFRMDGGPAPASVIALHDVSHLKALTRMQASFVSHVSHELRTPVTAIRLYVDLLQKRPAESERYLAALSHVADHQVRLVEDILLLSRIDAGQMELKRAPADLNILVEQTLQELTLPAMQPENVAFTYHHDDEPLPVNVDRDRVIQVVNNLVTNALYYTPAGGKVTLTTGMEMQEERKWAWVRVEDTGIGTSQEERSYLFQRFWRGQRAQQARASGSGLGLALVKEIVELHGGRVAVESEENVGSIFTIWLSMI
ncbi:MAG: PAS domain S-box protein [Anaerolineae bacterium]|nr:PAS domain S-box protein [Anaerolineae bacterium]